MSRIRAIAREDVRRAFRRRLVWGAIVLLAAMFLPSTGGSAKPDLYTIQEYILLLPLDLMTFSLVVVAAVGYSAVASERIDGTARFVLGLPATRRDLVLGKLLSRVGIVVASLVVILVVANGLVYQGYGRAFLLPFWVMGGWMLVYVGVWSAVAIGYSAAFDSPYRTLAALVVTYVVFSFNFGVWRVVVRPLFSLLVTGSLDAPSYETLATAPLWLQVVERLNPLVDFWAAMRWSIQSVGPGAPTGGALPHVLGTGIFLLFGILPLLFGIRRFERADLGGEQPGFQLGDTLWRALWGTRETETARSRVSRARTRLARVRELAIADLRHTLQDWVITGALVVTLLLSGPALWSAVDASTVFTDVEVLTRIPYSLQLSIVVLGIAVGHNAIAGERTAGTDRLLLGVGVTRAEVVLGKLLSRIGIIVAMLLAILLGTELLVVTRLGQPYPGAFIALSGWTLLFATSWTVITTGISAAVASRYRSLAVIFGVYLVFGRLWDEVVLPLVAFGVTGQFSTEAFTGGADPPTWLQYSDNLNPFVALETLQDGLFELAGYGTPHTELVVPRVLYSLGVVLVFAGAAFAIGTRRFDRSDLG